jgi:MYXO-CTERM domain-containing protein
MAETREAQFDRGDPVRRTALGLSAVLVATTSLACEGAPSGSSHSTSSAASFVLQSSTALSVASAPSPSVVPSSALSPSTSRSTSFRDATSMRVDLDQRGATLVSTEPGASWVSSLRLEVLSSGGRERRLATIRAQRVQGGEAALDHGGGVVEWYRRTALGVEQGFDLARPPFGARPGGLTLSIAVTGDLTPVVDADGRAVSLRDAVGRVALHYTDLSARDATRRALLSWMTVEGGRIALHVDDTGAIYPITIDPFVWATAHGLVAGPPVANARFGLLGALSGDIAVVGATPPSVVSPTLSIFERDLGGTESWGLVPVVLSSPSDPTFLSAVAVSGDLIAIGAIGGPGPGVVHLYQRDLGGPDAWGELTTLTPSESAANDAFGCALALSGDTLLVGASGDSQSRGAAYVFERNLGGPDHWGESKRLTAAIGAPFDQFGGAAALSGDDAAVAAPMGPVDGGRVHLFSRNLGGAENWGEVKTIPAPEPNETQFFGLSLGISGDRLLAGSVSQLQGRAYVLGRDVGGADAWGLVKVLEPTDGQAADYFGARVALSGDQALVGGGMGAYVFDRDALGPDSWVQQAKLTTEQVVPVAIDGTTALVGTPFVGSGGSQAGAAFIAEGRRVGQACGAPLECPTGFCVDGVCCDAACAGGVSDCVACSEQAGAARDGFCGPRVNGSSCDDGTYCDGVETCINGACHSSGDPCLTPSTGLGDACSIACDEASHACTAPNPDGAPCDDGVYCNGSETCQAGVCGASSGDPCASSGVCDESSHTCLADLVTCDGDHTLRTVAGAETDCSPYRCTRTNVCAKHCTSTAECVEGLVCTVDGTCAKTGSPIAGEGGCSCRVPRESAERGSSGVGWSALVAGIILAHRRRRVEGRGADRRRAARAHPTKTTNGPPSARTSHPGSRSSAPACAASRRKSERNDVRTT